jgi:PAS domain S-box-containing protein
VSSTSSRDEVQSRTSHVRQIARLACSVSSELELETVLTNVTHALLALRPDLVCGIRLIDHEAGGYRLVGTGGLALDRRVRVVPFGEGLTHVVAETRQPVLVADNQRDPRALKRHWSAGEGLTTYYGVPIEAGDQLLGVINVNFPPSAPPTEDEQASVELLAAHAAVAIRNARLYTEAARRRLAAEELTRIARSLTESLDEFTVTERIVESVLPLLGVHSSVLRRLQPDGSLVAIAVGGQARGHITRGHVIPPGLGVVGRVVEERRPIAREVTDETDVVRTADLRERMHAARMQVVLVVPLATREQIVGVLAVGAHAGRRFSEDDVDLLQAFADHATLALQNARLYEDVREARDFLQAIAENSADGIVTTDIRGRITSFSRAAEDVFGQRTADVLGRRITEYYEGGIEEGRAIMHRLRAEPRIPEYETALRRPDGSSVPTSASMSLLRGPDGTIVGTLGVFRDITERKRSEDALRHSEDQVRQLQKLEAIGQLAGGVAHDFNNLLTIILGRAELLLTQLPASDPLRRDLELTYTTAQRAAGLTKQLLAFSRKQMLEPKVLDPNAVVAGLATMLARLIGEDIDFAYRPGTDVGYLRADPGQLEQVIVNLVVNARDAMPTGGRITIETANVDLAEPNASERHEVAAGSYVMIGISDTGLGMDAATQARIFEPFFTTKALGKGTGLGLSTVYGIVKQSGGGISVYSEPGEGTSFKIYLPRVEAEEPEAAELPPAAAASGNETVLVVEDQDDVREFVREILGGYGYRVLEACDPAEALLIADRLAEPLHLLLADVVMPQMNGRELADRLTSLRPELKVLYMSGYAETAIVHHGRLDPGTVFIQKPFTPAALAGKVRALLDAVPAR